MSDRQLDQSDIKKNRFSKLSAKLALQVSFFTLLGTIASSFFLFALPVWFHPLLSVLVGVATYFISYKTLSWRLDLARDTLRDVRKHQFHNLEAAHLPQGDELNALIWQVYKAGLAMEKELQELKKIENYRKEFLGDVSHELKTPIFTIQGFTETLLDGALKDERVNEKFLRKILANTNRLSNLASDLVDISRIETGELEMNIATFSLLSCVEEVIEGLEHHAEMLNISLSHSIATELPEIIGDKSRISQVLVNLVENAVKYSNPGGTVEVVGRLLPSGDVKISVADNGIGIAPQYIPRLTERFFRVDKSRSREQGGTGLGLAIVKHILGAHETRMVIESRPGHGSTFGFTLASVHSAQNSDLVKVS